MSSHVHVARRHACCPHCWQPLPPLVDSRRASDQGHTELHPHSTALERGVGSLDIPDELRAGCLQSTAVKVANLFSSQEILCPFSTPYLGYQDPTGLFGGCNSFLGHSDTSLWRKPNKAWLFLFLTLTPGQRGAVTGCRTLPGNPELPLLTTCTASGMESCFLFGWLLCCCF